MTIIFDLDYTLLDTAAFKKELSSALRECGISDTEFQEVYSEKVEKEELVRDFDPLMYVKELRDSLSCSEEEVVGRIEKVAGNASSHLFPDAVEVLGALKSEGHRLMLMTHGNVAWQKKKVEQSGIRDVFDEVFYAPEKKEDLKDVLADIEMPAVMVNDNGKEIDLLGTAFPQYRMIAVRGPKPLPSDEGIPVCDNLKEVYSEIKKLV